MWAAAYFIRSPTIDFETSFWNLQILGKFNAHLILYGREDVGPRYVAKTSLNFLGSDWMEAFKLWNAPIASI